MNRLGMGSNISPATASSWRIDTIGAGEACSGAARRSEIALPRRQAGRPGVGSKNAVFEGSPVADARNVYVADDRPDRDDGDLRRLPRLGDRLDPLGPLCLRGQRQHRPVPWRDGYEISHRLLTLDGPTVYYQTNLGAVAVARRRVGLHPLAGHLSLAAPERRCNQGRERDLNPAIVHDGLVIVAPDDSPADLRLRRHDRPDGLEDRPDPRGQCQAHPHPGRGQGAT